MNQSWRKDYLRYKSYFLNVMGRYRERADIRVYLEILLSLATISIFSVFALRPTILTIAELIKGIEGKKEILTKMDEKISNLSKAQILLDQKREQVELLKISIPESPKPDILVRQIEGLSIKHTIPITRISLGKATILGQQNSDETKTQEGEPKEKTISGLTFSLNTAVSIEEYASLSNFIYDLERLRKPIIIEKIAINSERGEGQINLTSAVEARSPYYQKDNEAQK